MAATVVALPHRPLSFSQLFELSIPVITTWTNSCNNQDLSHVTRSQGDIRGLPARPLRLPSVKQFSGHPLGRLGLDLVEVTSKIFETFNSASDMTQANACQHGTPQVSKGFAGEEEHGLP